MTTTELLGFQPFSEKLQTFTSAGEYEQHIEYQAEYMDSNDAPSGVTEILQMIDEYFTMVIKAHMGVGKTTLLCKLMRQVWDQQNGTKKMKKMLVLSSRKTLSATLSASIEKRMEGSGANVVLYLDVPKGRDGSAQLQSADILVISPESLHRLNHKDVFNFNADLLIIDEFSSFDFHVAQSETMRRVRREVMFIYQCLMKEVPHVWLLDADFDDASTALVKRWRGMEKSLLLHNTNTKNPYQYFVHDFDIDEQAVIQQLRNDILHGVKCYVVSDGKRHSDRVDKRVKFTSESDYGDTDNQDLFNALQVEGKRGLLINSESNNEYAKFRDVDSWWSEYDYVVVSPTVSYGTSFDRSHFNAIYGFFSGRSVLPQTGCQMLHRIRKLEGEDKRVVLCVSGKTRFCEDTLMAVKSDRHRLVQHVLSCNLDSPSDWTLKRRKGVFRRVLNDTMFNDMYLDSAVKQLEGKCRFRQLLLQNIVHCGGTVLVKSYDDVPLWQIKVGKKMNAAEEKRAKEMIEGDFVRDFMTFPPITQEQEEEVENSAELKMGRKKRQLMAQFDLDALPDDPEEIEQLYQIVGENATARRFRTLLDSFVDDKFLIGVARRVEMDELLGVSKDIHQNVVDLFGLLGLQGSWIDLFGEKVETMGSEVVPFDGKKVWRIYNRLELAIKRKDRSKERKSDVVKVLNRYTQRCYGVELLQRTKTKRSSKTATYTYRVDMPALEMELVLSALPRGVFPLDNDVRKYDVEKVDKLLEKMKKMETTSDEENPARSFDHEWIQTKSKKGKTMVEFLEWMIQGTKCDSEPVWLGDTDDEGDGDGEPGDDDSPVGIY